MINPLKASDSKMFLVIINILNYPCKNPSNAGHNILTTVWQIRVLAKSVKNWGWKTTFEARLSHMTHVKETNARVSIRFLI